MNLVQLSYKVRMMLGREKYLWTNHSRDKMRYYRLTESRVKRIIRYPARIEEGIFENAIACMQPADGNHAERDIKHNEETLSVSSYSRAKRGGKKYSEIWALYVLAKFRGEKNIKIITAWRYPGKSSARDPIPPEILREIKSIL